MKRYYQILYRDLDNNINTHYSYSESQTYAYENFITYNKNCIVDNISEIFESTNNDRFILLKESENIIYISNQNTNRIYYFKLGDRIIYDYSNDSETIEFGFVF